jgi:predicted DNA-binding ribbon-helix-helix protein
LRKYSVRIAGHPTSISLEPEFWAAFGRAAERRGTTVAQLITGIDAERAGGLSSAIRLFVLADLEGRSA